MHQHIKYHTGEFRKPKTVTKNRWLVAGQESTIIKLAPAGQISRTFNSEL